MPPKPSTSSSTVPIERKKKPVSQKKSSSAGPPKISSILYTTLADAIGQKITVETTDGCSYRGQLDAVDREPNFNIRLSTVLVTLPNGMKDAALTIMIPGRSQKTILLPEAMKFAPRFNESRNGNGFGGANKARSNLGKDGIKKREGGGGNLKVKKPVIHKWGSKANALNKKKAKKE